MPEDFDLVQRIAECRRIDEPCVAYLSGNRVNGSKIEFFVNAAQHWPIELLAQGTGETLAEAIADCEKKLRLARNAA